MYRPLSERKSANRRVCNDLTVENQVAAQLLGGAVNGDNRMRMGVLDKGQKWAILACSDIKNDLARPAVHKVRSFMLVQRVQMAVEQSWKPILCGLAQSSVGGDVRASKDMRCSGRS